MLLKSYMTLVTCMLSVAIYSQSEVFPLSRSFNLEIERLAYKQNQGLHTGVLPYNHTDAAKFDSLFKQSSFNGYIDFWDKDSMQIKHFKLMGYPLLNVMAGYESGDEKGGFFIAGLGAEICVSVKDKLFMNISYINDDSNYPGFINRKIEQTNITPIGAYAKGTNRGYFYENVAGLIEYTPNQTFNFQLGHGKNKLGEGYRSLLLSDAANNYSFLKISTTVWKIKYVNIFSQYKVIDRLYDTYWAFSNKYATTHFLSWNATKWMNIGLFESVIWQGNDPKYGRGYDVNYLNPIIFFRPVEYSVGSPDNSLIGLNYKIKAWKGLYFYGQVAIDEMIIGNIVRDIRNGSYFTATDPWGNLGSLKRDSIVANQKTGWWANKQAYQLGFKWFDVAGVEKLYCQGELNVVRPYTYSHTSVYSSYTHYNRALAHPYGANFWELIGIARYNYSKLEFIAKIAYLTSGTDTSAAQNVGQDLQKDYKNANIAEYGNYLTQGQTYNHIHFTLNTSYVLNKQLNLRITALMGYRVENHSGEKRNSTFALIGLKSNFWNEYWDY